MGVIATDKTGRRCYYVRVNPPAAMDALLTVLYRGVVTPLAWTSRMVGHDPLHIQRSPGSLWQPPAPRAVVRGGWRADAGDGKKRFALGISAYYHDSAAALLKNGVIVAAAQEERFTRVKHDPRFPSNAVKYCLAQAGIGMDEVDLVVFYEDPKLKFSRLLSTFMGFAPQGWPLFQAAMPVWLRGKLFQRRMVADAITAATGSAFDVNRLVFTQHHLSHAASAFFASPFEEAVVVTIDGVGEYATTTIAVGRGNCLSIIKEIHFPHSLGLLYSAFTAYTGFMVNSGEYKLMGLAPYGTPRFADLIRRHLIDLKPDGSFWLNTQYLDYGRSLRTVNEAFEDLFGGRARRPDEPITQRHMDLASSIQVVLQEAVLLLASHAAKTTGQRNLCLAGGVALNCVANGHLERAGLFDRIWVQPASGDAGGALGAAYIGDLHHLGGARCRVNTADRMQGAYLGPDYSESDIQRELNELGAKFQALPDDRLFPEVAAALAQGNAVGWFSGRMEFGPRSLGNRSIIADPRSPIMQRTLNLKIKNRESFRPFAPAVLREDCSKWFSIESESPYMLMVANVRNEHCIDMTPEQSRLFGVAMLNVARSSIPCVTHVDRSARIQTVAASVAPRFHRLITAFKKQTGFGLLVNTSFNVRGEPIVCTVSDAFRCFMGTELDVLVVGNCLLRKPAQDPSLLRTYFDEVPKD